jgi:hypothetical protein
MKARILLTCGLLFISTCIYAAPAHAQHVAAVACGDGSVHPPGFDCRAYLCRTGWAQSHGHADACSSSQPANRSTFGPPTYAPPPTNNAAAEHEAEIERERAREKARARAAAEEKRRHEEFEKNKTDALKDLKGDSTSDLDLKGVGAGTIKDKNTPFFGLKGVGDTGIKDIAPARNPRDVSTAWKQLHCATEISGYALADATKLDGQIDLDEVRYLAGEAISALHGESLGVQCSEAPPMPKTYSQRQLDPSRYLPLYESMMQKTVKEAEKIQAINQELDALKQKEQKSRERLQELRSQTGNRPATKAASGQQANSESQQIAQAEAEQKAYHERERQRALEVYKEQKERQSAMADALAALRAAQRLINEQNAEKAQAYRVLQHYQDLNSKAATNPSALATATQRNP